MSKKINHWCVLCGKGYHACDSCNEIKEYNPWRSLTDTVEHFKIFVVLKDFNNKNISRDEAKAKLSELDLRDKDSFKNSAKNVLNEILGEEIITNSPTEALDYKLAVHSKEAM